MDSSSNVSSPTFDVSSNNMTFRCVFQPKYVKYDELCSLDYKGLAKKELSVKNSQI